MDLKKLIIIAGIVVVIGAIVFLSKMIGTINENVLPEKLLYSKIDNLSILASPSETSISLLTLNKGEKMEFLEDQGDWYKVINGGFTGFVKKENVSETPVE